MIIGFDHVDKMENVVIHKGYTALKKVVPPTITLRTMHSPSSDNYKDDSKGFIEFAHTNAPLSPGKVFFKYTPEFS